MHYQVVLTTGATFPTVQRVNIPLLLASLQPHLTHPGIVPAVRATDRPLRHLSTLEMTTTTVRHVILKEGGAASPMTALRTVRHGRFNCSGCRERSITPQHDMDMMKNVINICFLLSLLQTNWSIPIQLHHHRIIMSVAT